ncbi:hypothetical protein [Oleidesulfovibrio sp.]|uniref:hypothetical protein n=1 Tax=Oleidesulfovibrio sp. TaxID=2909707 RepID=UPI003A87CEC4
MSVAQQTVDWSLGQAKNNLSNAKNPSYPTYNGDQKTNPYASQQQAQGLMSTGYDPSMTAYQGLGQSPDQIRADFMQPVNQSWNNAQNQIANRFSANGLYGSRGGGLMSGALQDGAQNYATATAQANTLANQNIMQDEMNRINSTLDSYKLAGDQNLDAWKAGLTTTDYNNQQAAGQAQWGNSQIDAAYADQLARRQDEQAWQQRMFENYLGLAGGGSPMASATMQNDAAKYAANKQSSANNLGAWIGAGGSVLGGLLSGAGEANGFGNLFSWK